MNQAAKMFWLVMLMLGTGTAFIVAPGCSSVLSGSAPVDANIERADTNGVNHRIVADHLNQGILLVFPDGVPADFVSTLWPQLHDCAFFPWEATTNMFVLPKVTDSDAERAAIAAAIKQGAHLEPLPDAP